MRRALGIAALAIVALALTSEPAWAQRQVERPPVFGHTLFFGTGLINTPHAFVPRSSLFVTGSVLAAEEYRSDWSSIHARAAGGLSLARFLEVGIGVFREDVFAAFGKVQLVRQRGAFPAIAVGAMNVTTADIGRHGIHPDDTYEDVWEATSVYGVVTYLVGPGRGDIPSWVMISGGWGSGVFLEDNPRFERDDGTAGLFGSITFDFQAADEAFVRVITEWDGFDLNVGLSAWLSGLEVTVGIVGLEEGAALDPWLPGDPLPKDPARSWPGHFYNQRKAFASVTIDFRALGVIPWVWTTEEEQ
jgi:hypothetical protein